MVAKFQRAFRLIGFLIIVASSFFYLTLQIKKKRSIKVEATVVDIRKVVFEDFPEDKTYYHVTASYIIDSTSFQIEDQYGSSVNGKSAYEIGERIIIYVDPENPESYFIRNNNLNLFVSLFGLTFGLVMNIIGWLGARSIKVDTQDLLETSRKAHWTIKYGLFTIGFYLLLDGVRAEMVEIGSISIEGVAWLNTIQGMIFIGLGVLCLILGIILRQSFVILKFSDESIFLRKYSRPRIKKIGKDINVRWPLKQEKELKWEDVKSIKMFKYIYPPTYVLSMRHRFYLFATRDDSGNESSNPIEKFVRTKKVTDESELGEFLTEMRKKLVNGSHG